MYEIRKIHSNEVMEALALALEVFLQFEAPDYKPEGIETFKRDIVENDEFISKCQQGICPWNYRYVFKQEAYQLSIHKERISSSRCSYFNFSVSFSRYFERCSKVARDYFKFVTIR